MKRHRDIFILSLVIVAFASYVATVFAMPLGRIIYNKPPVGSSINYGHPLARGLKAVWLFNEQSGSKIYDTSLYDNTGTFVNTPVWSQNGLYFLDTDSDYITIDTGAVITDYPCTIFLRFKSNNITSHWTMFSISDASSASAQLAMVLNTDKFGAYIRNAGGFSQALTTNAFTANTWHTACGVWVHTTLRRAYLDANLGGMGTNTANEPMTAFDVTDIARLGDSTPGSYFGGHIDFIYIYDRVLEYEEVSNLHHDPYQIFHRKLAATDYVPAAAPAAIPQIIVIVN